VKFMLIHYIDESVLSWGEDGHELPGPEAGKELEAWDEEMIARGILVSSTHPTARIGTFELRPFMD
jgi:hypothetical protein